MLTGLCKFSAFSLPPGVNSAEYEYTIRPGVECSVPYSPMDDQMLLKKVDIILFHKWMQLPFPEMSKLES